ncbi:FecR domain-containing protein [Chitinophaga sp. YIM B06452]|uniref:FecR family protein n=1 Tax=Chitinophaga sp. YIM B06452 TaxID=3082158 RepID=UPI0031FEB76A
MKVDTDIIEQLTVKQITGVISQEDEDYLMELISGDSEAYAYYKELQAFYRSEDIRAKGKNFDTDASLGNTWSIINNRNRGIHRLMWPYSVAAVGIVAVGMLVYWMLPARKNAGQLAQQSSSKGIELILPNGSVMDLSRTSGQVAVAGATLNNEDKTLSYTVSGASAGGIATLRVPVGKDYQLQLSDGTQIWLNSASTVEFPFAFGKKREITIKGEAYIKVAASTESPFLVKVEGASVQALGTEFNVNTYDSGVIRVALVSGAVKMQALAETKIVKPGFEAVYAYGTPIQTHAFDEDFILAWRKGIYKFADTPLEDICKVLPRWFGMEVVMDNPAIARRVFTGKLDRNKSLQQQLENFKETTDLEYYIKDGVLHFR